MEFTSKKKISSKMYMIMFWRNTRVARAIIFHELKMLLMSYCNTIPVNQTTWNAFVVHAMSYRIDIIVPPTHQIYRFLMNFPVSFDFFNFPSNVPVVLSILIFVSFRAYFCLCHNTYEEFSIYHISNINEISKLNLIIQMISVERKIVKSN